MVLNTVNVRGEQVDPSRSVAEASSAVFFLAEDSWYAARKRVVRGSSLPALLKFGACNVNPLSKRYHVQS